MKKLILFILAAFIQVIAFSQSKLLESLTIKSKILGRDVEYSIYVPDGYEEGTRRYPVLYLLHGYTDDETGWTQFGEVAGIADKAIKESQATPMIVVMPDAGVTWYVNDQAGKTKFEDFFVKELIPFVDSAYRTRNKKEFRAIAGLSMGGYGSLIYAMKYPELFAACAPLSAAVWTDEEATNMPENNWNNVFGEIFGKEKGKARLTEHYKKNSILHLTSTRPVDDLKKVKFYIDCGDKDFLIKGNMALHAAMIDRQIPHEFRIRGGVHDWQYWRTALPEVLKFVSENFHR
jgi:S-formylglutathione hydrolase FrmB